MVAYRHRLYYIGGIRNTGQAVATVAIYDPQHDQWYHGPPLPAPRHHAAALIYRDMIYVLGGYASISYIPQQEVFILDPRSNQWSAGPSLPEARAAHAAGVIGNTLLVAGGATLGGTSADFEWYRLVTSLWDQRALYAGDWDHINPMPTPRQNIVSASIGKNFYVAGGVFIERNTENQTRYRPLDALETHQDLSRHAAAQTIREPSSQARWITASPMPTPRWNAAGGVVGPLFIIAGGENDFGVVSAVEAFDTRTNTWHALPPLPGPRQGASGAVVGTTFFVVGGGIESGLAFGSSNEAIDLQNFL